ncbi:MAG: hypothetical protein AAGB26_01475 [Planctomycetota bacterium]
MPIQLITRLVLAGLCTTLIGCANRSSSRQDTAQRLEAVVGGEGLWLDANIVAGTASDPIRIADRARPFLHLAHRGDQPVELALDYDKGDQQWERRGTVTLPAGRWGFQMFEATGPGERLRVVAMADLTQVTAWLTYVENAGLADRLEPTFQTPWSNATVQAGQPSASVPLLAHEKRYLTIASDQSAEVSIQIDVSGMGSWHTMGSLIVSPDETRRFNFFPAFNPKKLRLVSDTDATMTATFVYE